MNALRIWATAWCAILWGGSVHPADPANDVQARARVAAEQAAAQSRFESRQRECMTRFAVYACLDEARAERRTVLDRLRHEQHALDQADREQRAAKRLERTRERDAVIEIEQAREAPRQPKPASATAAQQPSDQPGSETASATPPESPAQTPMGAGSSGSTDSAFRTRPDPAVARAPSQAASASVAESAAERLAREARNEVAYRDRLREARERAESVRRRNQERAGRHKPAASLPVPSASSAPRPSAR